LRSDVSVVKAIVLHTELDKEFKSNVDTLEECVEGVVLIPRPQVGLIRTERIAPHATIERVPPAYRKATPFLHWFSQDDLILVVMLEGERILAALARKGNVFNCWEVFRGARFFRR